MASTVKAIQEAVSDKSSYVVLLTGRKAGTFDVRVKELLRQAGLSFDEVRLTVGDDSQAFKVSQIRRLLSEHPDVELVEMWEDIAEMIPAYKAATEEQGIEFKAHLVQSDSMSVLCEETAEGRLIVKVAERFLRSLGLVV